ncbi:hypothetical protein P4S72_14800 [Vibrio sp. PP-XX7]
MLQTVQLAISDDIEMADQLEYIFELILKDESPDQGHQVFRMLYKVLIV